MRPGAEVATSQSQRCSQAFTRPMARFRRTNNTLWRFAVITGSKRIAWDRSGRARFGHERMPRSNGMKWELIGKQELVVPGQGPAWRRSSDRACLYTSVRRPTVGIK